MITLKQCNLFHSTFWAWIAFKIRAPGSSVVSGGEESFVKDLLIESLEVQVQGLTLEGTTWGYQAGGNQLGGTQSGGSSCEPLPNYLPFPLQHPYPRSWDKSLLAFCLVKCSSI